MPKREPFSLDTFIEQYGFKIEVIVYLPREEALYGTSPSETSSIPVSLSAIAGSKFRRHVIDETLLQKLRKQGIVPSIAWATDVMVLLTFNDDASLHVLDPGTDRELPSAAMPRGNETASRVYSLDRTVFDIRKNRGHAQNGHRLHEDRLLIKNDDRSALLCIRAAVAENEDRDDLQNSVGRLNDRAFLLDIRVQ